jgi:hypothetical protein
MIIQVLLIGATNWNETKILINRKTATLRFTYFMKYYTAIRQ